MKENKPTAYECFLHKSVLEETKNNPLYTKEDIMSFFIYQDCLQGNSQAFDLVSNTKEENWTKDTFYNAAKLIITKFNQPNE